MKKLWIHIVIVVLLSGCASLKTPGETNIAVSTLLTEIQAAVDKIAEETGSDSGLPSLHGASLVLTTSKGKTLDGKIGLVVSGEISQTTTNSSVMTLHLVPSEGKEKLFENAKGQEIAEHVIAAVRAVDGQKDFKLRALMIEAGLEFKRKNGAGLEWELAGLGVGGSRSSESAHSNKLTLVFGSVE